MHVELHCPSCSHVWDADTAEALDRMSDEGPWSALGDCETFEDRIFAALAEHGTIHCPACAEPVPIREECVVELAQEMLAHW
jgi:hypothetical protein